MSRPSVRRFRAAEGKNTVPSRIGSPPTPHAREIKALLQFHHGAAVGCHYPLINERQLWARLEVEPSNVRPMVSWKRFLPRQPPPPMPTNNAARPQSRTPPRSPRENENILLPRPNRAGGLMRPPVRKIFHAKGLPPATAKTTPRPGFPFRVFTWDSCSSVHF